jgi:hypothetical protein
MGWVWATFSQNDPVTLFQVAFAFKAIVVFRVARWLIYLQTKNSNLGIFLRALEYKMLVYIFYAHLNILRQFYGNSV